MAVPFFVMLSITGAWPGLAGPLLRIPAQRDRLIRPNVTDSGLSLGNLYDPLLVRRHCLFDPPSAKACTTEQSTNCGV